MIVNYKWIHTNGTTETDREVEDHDEVQMEESAEGQTSNSTVATTITTK